MMKILLLPGIAFFALITFELSAKCPDNTQFQTIEIRADRAGKPYVDNKAENDKCRIQNNRLTNTSSASHIKWVFLGLKCKEKHCDIRFDHQEMTIRNSRKPQAYADRSKYKKHILVREIIDEAMVCSGNPNYFVCVLRVNELKRYCEKFDENDYNYCTMKYNIYVGDNKIDPSIIIKPRPLF